MNINQPKITSTDFYLVSFIGAAFALFSVPILINLDISIIKITPVNIALLVLFFVVFANLALAFAWYINRLIPIAFQFAKFGAVGAFNTFVDWGILNTLIFITGIAGGTGFALFKGISFIVATLSAYFWNKYWTFQSKDKTNSSEITKFITVSVIGFFINVGLASIIIYLFSSTTLVTPEQLANIAAATATAVSLFWNFFGYKLFVFKK